MIRLLLIGFLLLGFSGCATNFVVSSNPPDVGVYLGNKRLGATPVVMNKESIGEPNSAGGYLIRFEKPGYQKVHFWFPKGMQGVNIAVNLEPFVSKTREVELVLSKARLDQLSELMLGNQTKLLLQRDFSQSEIQKLMKDFPEISTVYFLGALADLRRGNKVQAREKMKQALRLSPGEPGYVSLYQELGGDPVGDILADSVKQKGTRR